jgi:hypothetical protein
MLIEVIKHEAIPGCGSYEVRFPDGRPSKYIYWEDVPSRRLKPLEQLTSEEACIQLRRFGNRSDK